MPNNPLTDPRNLPLDLYLEDIELFSQPFPTHDEVKAAIHTFCPFDPKTGDMLAKKSESSLHVLTRILYVPFYPELLGLLNTPIFVAKCLMDIEEYLQRHKVNFVCQFSVASVMISVQDLWPSIWNLNVKGSFSREYGWHSRAGGSA